jgi:hypothetical protein
MSRKRHSSARGGIRHAYPGYGDGDQDFDEWCQACQRCGREHIWANYENPEYDPQAYRITVGIMNIATSPELFALLEEMFPPNDVLRQAVTDFRARLDTELDS